MNPVCLEDFEKYAVNSLDKNALDYIRSGSFYEETLRDNREAFSRYKLRPRVLRDVSQVDTSTTIQGERVSMPICIAPTGMHRLAHPDGEVATAKAASRHQICYTMSMWATETLEAVTSAAPSGLKWFNLYIYKDRQVSLNLVHKAEREGFKAIVLTVDAQIWGRHLYNERKQFKLPPHMKLKTFNEEDRHTDDRLMSEGIRREGMGDLMDKLYDPSITWEDVRWLKRNTQLKVIIKGILTAEDALEARISGVDGIIVSNHGGRQLDSVAAAIDALQEVVDTVGKRCEVYLDGGVRSGIDVVKALALGARAVLIGRPIIWGLVYDGENGVHKVLQILREEFKVAMALLGARTVGEIVRPMVVQTSNCWRSQREKSSKL